MTEQNTGHYAPINGLNMYYEIHGEGEPLVLLHGGLTTINGTFGMMLETLADAGRTRQLIAVEQQAHGHTADIDRPLSFEQMADDTAALLHYLNIEQADFFGYSSGGSVALNVAMRYPGLVRKLVLVSTVYSSDGYYSEILEGLRHASAEAMPPIMREEYARVAPRPEDWPKLIEKASQYAREADSVSSEMIQKITAPTLLAFGDSDIVRTEYAVEMFRLLPIAQLAILPATDHVGIMFQRSGWLLSMIGEFLK